MKGTCYAKSLGGCDKISKEHYFSYSILKNFFPGLFTVEGTKLHKTNAKSFFAKILCAKHNQKLNVLDTEATKLFRLYRSISLKHEQSTNHTINGALIERWLLKVYLGAINAGHIKNLIPNDHHDFLVNVLFGESLPHADTGMHSIFPEKDTRFEIDCSLGLQILGHSSFIVRICNLLYYVSTIPHHADNILINNRPAKPILHPIGGQFDQGGGHIINVKFTWY